MKKQSFGKMLSFLPALAMLAVIFSFSAQTGTQSGGLSQTVSQWLVAHWRALSGGDYSPDAIALQAKTIEFWVRKGAHMTEYAPLWRPAMNSTSLLSPDAGHRCGMWVSIPWAHCAHWVY